MCDVKKYFELTMEADSAEQKDFFEMIGNYLLQQKQKAVIKGNLF